MLVFKAEKDIKHWKLKNNAGLEFTLLENGSLYSLMHQDILINQYLGSPVEGGLTNVYLRIKQAGQWRAFPILGPQASSYFYPMAKEAFWQGKEHDLAYSLCLGLDENTTLWFWSLEVKNLSPQPQTWDAMLVQDLGLACKSAVRTNEAYNSQYIDHTVVNNPRWGYVVCSRQNQSQGQNYPWIMQGCLEKARGYLTDGFQFYGLQYKDTNIPTALKQEILPNRKLQYECSQVCLQTFRQVIKTGQSQKIHFFARYQANHPSASSSADIQGVQQVLKAFKQLAPQPGFTPSISPISSPLSLFSQPRLFSSRDLTLREIEHYFPGPKRHVEKQGKQWQSFFYQDHLYVALKAKELKLERPHGHILRSGCNLLPNEDTLSYTVYMHGVFNSQLTLGNTSFNKLISVTRHPLNVLKSSGQRLFVKLGQAYELLGMPSAFEVGMNHARWIYQAKTCTLLVTTWTSLSDPVCFLDIEVKGQKQCELIITHNLVLGNNEYDTAGLLHLDLQRKRAWLRPGQGSMLAKHYPQATFYILPAHPIQIESISGDGLLYPDSQERQQPFLTFKTCPLQHLTLIFTGSILSYRQAQARAKKYASRIYAFKRLQSEAKEFWQATGQRLSVSPLPKEPAIRKINDIFYWFLHNAMVHCTIPRGLEQYNGAAWGLRDVCQGPVELFLATQHYAAVKQILRTVFAHQYLPSGDWPQWFMFDRYQKIQSAESHGDIIFWPIKALCDYIEATNDFSILQEKVGYTQEKDFHFTTQRETIFAHTLREIAKIKRECIAGTALVRFGHGDWEDTLQPAHPDLKQNLISTWTIALAYQTINHYARICQRAGKQKQARALQIFTQQMQHDFNAYLIPAGVVAGLAYFAPSRKIKYLLHPQDHTTGQHYRLLPMTRGMISELFTLPQMKRHAAIIRQALLFPDGVRLMEKPLEYRGGQERHFRRAESAANFGREIGLMYTHAHIRYLEAMAKIGDAEALYRGLLMVIPILLSQVVPSALPRQSNTYYSSSDANFPDRYQAQRFFSQIKKGNIGFKGGWRIYSSGPGIYIHLLICHFLGIRQLFDDMVFDPVLSRSLSGLTCTLEWNRKLVQFRYIIAQGNFSPRYLIVNGKKILGQHYLENPYRRGGLLISKQVFGRLLNKSVNQVEIHL